MELSKLKFRLITRAIWPEERSFFAHHAWCEIPVTLVYSPIWPHYLYGKLVISTAIWNYFCRAHILIWHYYIFLLFLQIYLILRLFCHYSRNFIFIFIFHLVFCYLQETLLQVADQGLNHGLSALFSGHVQSQFFA